MAQRTFIIGDIHGCSKTFRHLLHEVLSVTPADRIICVGDYIDRGPDSKGVVDLILDLLASGHDLITLRGNHEQLLLDAFKSLEDFDLWIVNGGEQTLESFDAAGNAVREQPYADFFRDTPYYYMDDDLVAVHAGLNFHTGDPFSDHESMLWIRDFAPDPVFLNGRLLVHGHTPRPLKVIIAQSLSGAVNIDAGCVYNHRPGYGYLVALELEAGKFHVAKNVDSK